MSLFLDICHSVCEQLNNFLFLFFKYQIYLFHSIAVHFVTDLQFLCLLHGRGASANTLPSLAPPFKHNSMIDRLIALTSNQVRSGFPISNVATIGCLVYVD